MSLQNEEKNEGHRKGAEQWSFASVENIFIQLFRSREHRLLKLFVDVADAASTPWPRRNRSQCLLLHPQAGSNIGGRPGFLCWPVRALARSCQLRQSNESVMLSGTNRLREP